jgi:hypothetical protein
METRAKAGTHLGTLAKMALPLLKAAEHQCPRTGPGDKPKLSDTSVRVSVAGESEVVHLGSDGRWQAALERGGVQTVLLEADAVKPWTELPFPRYACEADRGKSWR